MAAPEQSRVDSPTRVTRQRTADEAPPQPADAPLADQQAAIGNRELQGRLARGGPLVQTKLEVSGPSDAHEREADRVADTIMTMPDPAVQRQEADEVDEFEEEAAPKLARQADTDEIENLEEEALAPRLDRQADAEELEEPEEEALAPKAAATPVMTPATESAIARSRGDGHPLDSATRGFFEPRFGRDLSGVKAHTDPGAARLASDMGAQAFTVGRDVYFAEGRYQPGTESGRSLLAHELTHTVQQQPGAKLADPAAASAAVPLTSRADRAVQRQADDSAGESDNVSRDPDAGEITEGSDPHITYPVLKIMNFKARDHRGDVWSQHDLTRSREYSEDVRPTDYGQKWKNSLDATSPTMENVIEDQLASTVDPTDPGKLYILKHDKTDYRLVGTIQDLIPAVKQPLWNREGRPDPKDVDHMVELVVSGWPGTEAAWANEAGAPEGGNANMELLDNQANRASGRKLGVTEIPRLLRATREHYWRQEGEPVGNSDPNFWIREQAPTNAEIKERYDLVFNRYEGGYSNEGNPENYWQWEEVNDGKHLEDFRPDTSPGSNSTWAIFPSSTGGVPKLVDHTGDEMQTASPAMSRGWLDPFTVEGYYLDDPGTRQPDDAGEIGWIEVAPVPSASGRTYAFFEGGGAAEVFVKPFPGLPNAGYLDSSGLLQVWDSLTARGLSPVQIESFTLVPGEGFHARGTLLPDVPIMADLGIDLVVEGNAVFLEKSFEVGDFDLPGPVEITHSTVTVTAGTNGLGAGGELGLAIEGVGEGLITARIDTESGFALTGTFTFDPELFDPPSQIELGYENGEFSGSGTLTIGQGRVRGIKTASITASYAGGQLEATGDAELDVSGLERGTMTLSYSEAEGFAIGGSFDVSSDVPGISSGSVSAEVRQEPGEEGGYAVSASGTAVPDIPGVSTRVDVSYDDGIFTAQGTAAYERGLLAGSLTVGATNESVDDEGNPTGEAGDTLRAFGGGDLTLQLAPWLEATAGVRLTPEGEVEVTGQIGLPEALEVFPERRYDRNILSIDVDIPIVGITVPVIRRNIGIFASIGGGLDLTAGFGPGELRELGLEISYNPEREEETEVTGGAEFVVPADAGLRLFVRGALGAGIPVVDARLGLEIGGGLGIEGAVRAAVEVAWTPTDGIELDAEAEIFAEPKLKLDITGFASVEADVGFASYDLYSERWRLAGFEYGSGLRLGATFPIHYVEGEPFDVSMDDIEFQVPDVNPRALLSGIVDEFT